METRSQAHATTITDIEGEMKGIFLSNSSGAPLAFLGGGISQSFVAKDPFSAWSFFFLVCFYAENHL